MKYIQVAAGRIYIINNADTAQVRETCHNAPHPLSCSVMEDIYYTICSFGRRRWYTPSQLYAAIMEREFASKSLIKEVFDEMLRWLISLGFIRSKFEKGQQMIKVNADYQTEDFENI